MIKLAGLRHRLGGTGPCLIDVTELRQSRGQRREHRHVRRDEEGPHPRARREVGQFTKAKTSLKKSASESDFAEKKTGVPVVM